MGGISRHRIGAGSFHCCHGGWNGRRPHVPYGCGENASPNPAEPRAYSGPSCTETPNGAETNVGCADTDATDFNLSTCGIAGASRDYAIGHLVVLYGSEDDLQDGGRRRMVPRRRSTRSVDQHPEWDDAGHVPIPAQTVRSL